MKICDCRSGHLHTKENMIRKFSKLSTDAKYHFCPKPLQLYYRRECCSSSAGAFTDDICMNEYSEHFLRLQRSEKIRPANLLSWAEVSCSQAGTGCVESHSECGKKTVVFTNRQCAVCPGTVCLFCVLSFSACVCRGVGGRTVWPWRRGCLHTAHALIAAAACLCSSANAAEDCTSWGRVVNKRKKAHRYALWLECKVPLLWQVQYQLNNPEQDSLE